MKILEESQVLGTERSWNAVCYTARDAWDTRTSLTPLTIDSGLEKGCFAQSSNNLMSEPLRSSHLWRVGKKKKFNLEFKFCQIAPPEWKEIHVLEFIFLSLITINLNSEKKGEMKISHILSVFWSARLCICGRWLLLWVKGLNMPIMSELLPWQFSFILL